MTSKIKLRPTDFHLSVLGEPNRRWHGCTPSGIEVDVFCSGIVAWRRQDSDALADELAAALGTVDPRPGTTPRYSAESETELAAYRRCVAALLQCPAPNGPPGLADATLRSLLVGTVTAERAASLLRQPALLRS